MLFSGLQVVRKEIELAIGSTNAAAFRFSCDAARALLAVQALVSKEAPALALEAVADKLSASSAHAVRGVGIESLDHATR
jgi:hypothetical protein